MEFCYAALQRSRPIVAMNKAFLFSILLVCSQGWSSTAPSAPREAQAKAQQKYPALGVEGSDFQSRFTAESEHRQTADPTFFKNPEWPILLADELAAGDAGPGPEFVTTEKLRRQAGEILENPATFVPVGGSAVAAFFLYRWVRQRRLRRHQQEQEKFLTLVDF